MAGKSIDFDKLKQTKVTVPLIVLLGVVWLGWNAKDLTADALGEFFLSKAVAEEQYKVLTEQTTETRTLIVLHINEYKLNENARAVRTVTNQLYELQFYVAANGESDLTRDRKRDLENEVQKLSRVRACIIRNAQLDEDQPPENCDAII